MLLIEPWIAVDNSQILVAGRQPVSVRVTGSCDMQSRKSDAVCKTAEQSDLYLRMSGILFITDSMKWTRSASM